MPVAAADPKPNPGAAAEAVRRLLQDGDDAPAANVTAGQSLAGGQSDLSCVGCSGYDTRTQVASHPCLPVRLNKYGSVSARASQAA